MNGRIAWILHNSVGDGNYKSNLPLLTNRELMHCLEKETRPSSARCLVREAKKRNIIFVETPAGFLAAAPTNQPDFPGIEVYNGSVPIALIEHAVAHKEGRGYLFDNITGEPEAQVTFWSEPS